MQRGIPIWHGLNLAQKILGHVPQAVVAQEVVRDWERGLLQLVYHLERKPRMENDFYNSQMLRAWKDCIRD